MEKSKGASIFPRTLENNLRDMNEVILSSNELCYPFSCFCNNVLLNGRLSVLPHCRSIQSCIVRQVVQQSLVHLSCKLLYEKSLPSIILTVTMFSFLPVSLTTRLLMQRLEWFSKLVASISREPDTVLRVCFDSPDSQNIFQIVPLRLNTEQMQLDTSAVPLVLSILFETWKHWFHTFGTFFSQRPWVYFECSRTEEL